MAGVRRLRRPSCWSSTLVWGRRHSALNAGGADGYIPTAVPGDDDVMFVEEPKDHHFVTKHKDAP